MTPIEHQHVWLWQRVTGHPEWMERCCAICGTKDDTIAWQWRDRANA